ncbi:olfactory receptor 14A2-like isoform X2 [Cricetulus griseus]|uniref:Olfactory receptor n=1 Tax=Cricetulus griseus TaxID=10029 RepID=A0A9J7FPN9_CRIGR|nr:olfactory receptor 14A2-like isoform X2 [Cricetulus griseus]
MSNVTAITGFILMGFSDIHELETLCGVTFLLTYLLTLMSNFLTITLITLDLKLQSPMYFFLKNLSLLDIFLVSVTIPNFFVHSLTYNNSISTLGCACQVFFMASFGSGEVFVLTVMSYDRYVAVCSPLHYDAIMNNVTCMLMMGASWSTALLLGVMYTAAIFSMPFCGSNVISQIFCDVPSLLRILCSKSFAVIYTSLGIGLFLGMFCFICIVISYFYIFSTVLKIPTTKGQYKAFATCLPHLIVFTVYIATACFAYLKPPSNTTSIIDRFLSMLHTVLPPALNPVIYSLRNTDVHNALKRVLQNFY